MTIDLLVIVPVALLAFVATNLDNFMILVTLLARYQHKLPWVVTAYLCSIVLLIFVSWWIGDVADNIPVTYLGFLGIVPMVIGVTWLLRAPDQVVDEEQIEREGDHPATVFGVTLASQVSNGTDTIVTFSILFADSMPIVDGLIAGSMGLMGFMVLFLAYLATRHPMVKQSISQFAGRFAPFVMIGVGFYILANTATDLLV